MKPRICQSKRKDGNQCKGNALGGNYFCYVHQDSKDPILIRDPELDAWNKYFGAMESLINWHHRTGGDISRYFGNYTPPPEKNPYRKQPNLNRRYTPPMRNK
jgi:hypothetical protein